MIHFNFTAVIYDSWFRFHPRQMTLKSRQKDSPRDSYTIVCNGLGGYEYSSIARKQNPWLF